jgi:branched-chain amino acid transport system ATP-binding protein
MSAPLLQVSSLSVRFGAIDAVHDVSFDVHQGEIVALIGANGAGKTTTLRAVSRLIPAKGNVRFYQQDIERMAPHSLVAMGLVHAPEGRGIFLNLTVEENLTLGSYLSSDAKETARLREYCFDLFPRLKERLFALAGTLSGGEQQMLTISRAILSRPKLLMLDEPSLGLAPKVVSLIFSIVERLNKEGMTILLVEQNARMALKVCHRAYVLETGSIRLSGTGQELMHNSEVQRLYLGH